ncbi:MAG TPA: hypothetical protein VGK33_11980 [Chloroflexota bacterium]
MLVAAALLAGVALVAAAALVGVRVGVSSARLSARASSAGGFAALPVPLRGLVSGTLGRSDHAFWVSRAGSGFESVNAAQGFSADFSDSGVRVSARGGRLALSLAGVGYGSSLRPVGSPAPTAAGNRVSYADGAFTQWFENGPLGLEQGFTLRAPPAGAARGPMTVALRVRGSLRAHLVSGGDAIDFTAPGGRVALRYVGLSASDARGRLLHAWLEASGSRLLVRVDARGARYPLRIDPFVQQGAKLVGTGAVGHASQGWSVALSGNGNTALVGGPTDDGDVGAVWVFTRAGKAWSQYDGDTALVGDPYDNCTGARGSCVGAAWLFTRAGKTWTQQGPKLVGTGAQKTDASEGSSVALSSDGNTALVGGPLDNCTPKVGCVGAAWVFTRSGTTWTQQGPKLVGAGGGNAQGTSVALSGDGNTALVGGTGGHGGAAWVFTRSGTTWTQQGRKLVGTGAAGEGRSVALSGDGNTALVGGYSRGRFVVGAVWVFTRSGKTWTQQGPKLVGTGAAGCGCQSLSVALSSDGNTALSGGAGVAWVFTRSRTTWTQQGRKPLGTLRSSGSVALSSDGNTALVSGGNGGVGAAYGGAAWVFVTRAGRNVADGAARNGR